MRWLCLVLMVAACSSSVAPRSNVSDTSTAAPHDGEALCCCEITPPDESPARFESRASACTLGTPATPEGACVDWTACGFAAGTARTTADRPDLAAHVAVPTGSCCCDATDGFAIVATASCSACLDVDWCEPAAPVPPPPHTPAIAGVDRCVQIADHFEPWRKNPDWATEVSPRTQLIADCRAKGWSPQLQDCLLAANAPLELDDCVAYSP